MSVLLKRIILGAAAVLFLGWAGYRIIGSMGDPAYVKKANTRTLMDAESGELFQIELTDDMPGYPHKNPKTGKATLYPTEICYARSCGTKPNGTPVILNSHLGKSEPTLCPECGALVRLFNPDPRGSASSGDAAEGEE